MSRIQCLVIECMKEHRRVIWRENKIRKANSKNQNIFIPNRSNCIESCTKSQSFLATHWYIPLSFLSTEFKWITWSYEVTLIRLFWNEIELPLWNHSIDGWGVPETEQFNEIDLPTSTDWIFGVILTWRGAEIKLQLVNHNKIR